MTSSASMRVALVCAVLVAASPMTQAAGTHQNHHCKMADGTMDTTKTKKACLAAKGTWAKDATPAAEAASAPKK